ncbi:hypothetical protein D3C80_1973980 [compost metagenome]
MNNMNALSQNIQLQENNRAYKWNNASDYKGRYFIYRSQIDNRYDHRYKHEQINQTANTAITQRQARKY